MILSLRWANTHAYLLQEEPAAISFLEVNRSSELLPLTPGRRPDLLLFFCPQELYSSLSNDSRMLRALKDLAPDLEKVVKLQ